MKLIDLKGRKFGNLTVIKRDYEYSKNFKSKRPYWICECECGTRIVLSGSFLSSGRATSCEIRRKLENGESAFNMLFRNYSGHAKTKGLEFSLEKEDFKRLTKGNCFYCGAEPNYTAKKGKDIYIYNGVDRVNNAKGYCQDNVVSCCGICNHAKKGLSQESFLLWVQKIYNNIKEK